MENAFYRSIQCWYVRLNKQTSQLTEKYIIFFSKMKVNLAKLLDTSSKFTCVFLLLTLTRGLYHNTITLRQVRCRLSYRGAERIRQLLLRFRVHLCIRDDDTVAYIESRLRYIRARNSCYLLTYLLLFKCTYKDKTLRSATGDFKLDTLNLS